MDTSTRVGSRGAGSRPGSRPGSRTDSTTYTIPAQSTNRAIVTNSVTGSKSRWPGTI
jgi:hypothetical protein